jgi:hypothetical protein
MECGAFRSTSNKRCRVALPYPDEMREMGALVGKGESIWATKGQQTGRSPDEPGRAPVLLQSRIPSADELHRTPAAVYETEGHRFESCRARFSIQAIRLQKLRIRGREPHQYECGSGSDPGAGRRKTIAQTIARPGTDLAPGLSRTGLTGSNRRFAWKAAV